MYLISNLKGCRLHSLGFSIDIVAGYVIVCFNALSSEKGIMAASPIVKKVHFSMKIMKNKMLIQ
ncbi:MAG TPA: hypothetical protein DCZ48_05660 [Methylococcaceae bacterium]|nr:hypothetical protein [Methylococcaceae bacterium]